jgi:acyl carrier protein
MTPEEIKVKIIEILQRYIFDKSVWDKAPANPKIIADLKINSARIVDVVLDIEDFYKITIDDKSLEKIISVDDAVAITIQKLQELKK